MIILFNFYNFSFSWNTPGLSMSARWVQKPIGYGKLIPSDFANCFAGLQWTRDMRHFAHFTNAAITHLFIFIDYHETRQKRPLFNHITPKVKSIFVSRCRLFLFQFFQNICTCLSIKKWNRLYILVSLFDALFFRDIYIIYCFW